MRKKILVAFSAFVFFTAIKCTAQKDSTSKFSFNGYVDAYYAYYTDSVGDGNFQQFPSVSPRSDQFGLNAICLTGQYDAEKVRALVTLHYGDIPVSAWSSTFNNIMEAHAGVRLCNKLWLDAGFFRTHVGAEGLLPKENFTSSVSVTTFYEPYFESGIRLNYSVNDKLAINLFVLNGYNIFEDNNKKKSIGILATYAFSDKGSIGYNNYIGDDTPTGASKVSHLRVYQNLFFNYQINKLKIQLGLDYAVQAKSKLTNGNKSASMVSGVIGLKYQVKEKFAVYARAEMFNDPDGFMSGVMIDDSFNLTGLKISGFTLGAEYKPTENSYVRIEGRQLTADKDLEIFYFDGKSKNNRSEILINLGVSF